MSMLARIRVGRSKRPWRWLVAGVRVLLAAVFVPAGVAKVLMRTAAFPESDPGAAFFTVLTQTEPFWSFIGATEFAAGVLLLVPRCAHLGALLLVPVVTCIVVINFSVGAGAVTGATAVMLLVVLCLLAWDGDRFRGLFAHGVD